MNQTFVFITRGQLLLAAFAATLASAQEMPETFGFGEPASEAEIAAWDIDIKPDGKALPPGQGTVSQGETLYVAQCIFCHGNEDVRGPNDRLMVTSPEEGFPSAEDVNAWEHRIIGNYWPYATTLFDYIRRSMPMNMPGSLEDDEVYALTAYLLYKNHIIEADATLDADALRQIRMPAAGRFVVDDRLDYQEVH